MSYGNLSDDSLAIILLCTNLALNSKVDNIKPLTTAQYSKFAKILFNSSIKNPANLFNLSKAQIIERLLIEEKEAERIVNLLEKAGQLSFQLDKLNKIGIKIITRADSLYPKILKKRLKDKCPPVIYYCGDISMLEDSLIGVVGSRNIDVDATIFTKKIAKKIVDEGYSLVSGGARGVDNISQEEVLKNNGRVVAFIADSIINKVKKKEIRKAIIDKKLLLMSTVNPSNRFTVYSAMDRNKYIYGLSDITIIVSSDYNKGGTWEGAKENLKNKWVKTLVREEKGIPKGNIEIMNMGGIPFTQESFNNGFKKYISEEKNIEYGYYKGDLLSLVNNNNNNKHIQDNYQKINSTQINEEENKLNYKQQPNIEINYDVYELILDKIKESLSEGLSLEEFKCKFNVNRNQAIIWLNRAIDEGIVKKTNKPVRYIIK